MDMSWNSRKKCIWYVLKNRKCIWAGIQDVWAADILIESADVWADMLGESSDEWADNARW